MSKPRTVARRVTVVAETEQAVATERALPKATRSGFANAIRATRSSCFGSITSLDANIPLSSVTSPGRLVASFVFMPILHCLSPPQRGRCLSQRHDFAKGASVPSRYAYPPDHTQATQVSMNANERETSAASPALSRTSGSVHSKENAPRYPASRNTLICRHVPPRSGRRRARGVHRGARQAAMRDPKSLRCVPGPYSRGKLARHRRSHAGVRRSAGLVAAARADASLAAADAIREWPDP
ncbi:hypothetical protein SAMN03159448_06286 [Sinorhizobium sp. NFACC03]|nr:hypothetical protein SAMN03159448_06286 [Sinorhizobium sp. NFACC03]